MADIGLRYIRNKVLNTDFFPENDKVNARKAYESLLDEFNYDLISDFFVLYPDGKTVKKVEKTISLVYAIMVRFCDKGRLYPYKSDEEIPAGQKVLVDGAGRLQVLKVEECKRVTLDKLNELAEGHPVKPVLAICVDSMKQVRKEGA